MVETCTRGGICHSIYGYAKVNNKYLKHYEKNKESSYLQYWDVNNLHGWAMSQKLPVNNFEWIDNASQFSEDFIKKTIMEDVMKLKLLKIFSWSWSSISWKTTWTS